MDIEWAKDGITGELFILQARPETVHSQTAENNFIESYELTGGHGAPFDLRCRGWRQESVRAARCDEGTRQKQTSFQGRRDPRSRTMTVPAWEPIMKTRRRRFVHRASAVGHMS
jgi:pyruvate,water dikinase